MFNYNSKASKAALRDNVDADDEDRPDAFPDLLGADNNNNAVAVDGGTSPSRRSLVSAPPADDLDTSLLGTSGFSPNSLLSRYTAEMDFTQQSPVQPPPSAAATNISGWSNFFAFGGGTTEEPTLAPTNVVTSKGESGSGSGMFGHADKFERVDQSVNLMDADAATYVTDDTRSEASGRSHSTYSQNPNPHRPVYSSSGGRDSPSNKQGSKAFQRSSVKGGKKTMLNMPRRPNPYATKGGVHAHLFTANTSNASKQPVPRSRSLKDIVLGNLPGVSGYDMPSGPVPSARGELLDVYGEEDDNDKLENGSCFSCCICLFTCGLIAVIIAMLAGGIPPPWQWGQQAQAEAAKEPQLTPTEIAIAQGKEIHSIGGVNFTYDENSPAVIILGAAPKNNGTSPSSTYSFPSTPIPEPKDVQRTHLISNAVVAAGLTSSKTLLDPRSIPSLALRWIADTDAAKLPVPNAASGATLQLRSGNAPTDDANTQTRQLLERYALAVLFYETHAQANTLKQDAQAQLLEAALRHARGELTTTELLHHRNQQAAGSGVGAWIRQDGWMGGAPVCQWYGVTCDASTQTPIALRLSQNNVQGQLPLELKGLASTLQVLDVSDNRIAGRVHSAFFENTGTSRRTRALSGNATMPGDGVVWEQLIQLDVSHNQLTGPLPTTIGGAMPRMTYFSASYNVFDGSLPTGLNELTQLEALALEQNKFSGTLVPLTNLQKLRTLTMCHNHFEGTFPFMLTGLTNLEKLTMAYNNFTATIPPEFQGLSNLNFFGLHHTQVQGPLPDIFHRLRKLETLYLDHNLLGQAFGDPQRKAPLPITMGQLSALKILMLNNNQLFGVLPVAWMNITSLETLDLRENDLHGFIPHTIQQLTNLKELQLSNNSLTGHIPPTLAKCTKIETISLQGNGLIGSIPQPLCNLKNQSRTLTELAADCKSGLLTCDCCDECY